MIELHMVVKKDSQTLTLWHDLLGHPDSIMMWRLLKTHMDINWRARRYFKPVKISCETCSLGKLIMRSLPIKIKIESPHFLNVFKVIYVGLFTHCVDHFDTLWCWHMTLVDGHTFVYYLLAMWHL